METDWEKLRPLLAEAIGTTVYLVLLTFVVGGLIGLFLGTALYTTRKGGLLANAPIHWLLNVAVDIVRLRDDRGGLVRHRKDRRTEPGHRGPRVIEAARAMGARPMRIIFTYSSPKRWAR